MANADPDNQCIDKPEGAGKASSGGTTRRQFIGRSGAVLLGIGGSSAFLAACGGGGGGEVRVLSWISYVDPTVKKLWAEAYPDIKMIGIAAESDQDMFTKIKAGGSSQYDVVFANCGWSPTYYENELIEPTKLEDVPASEQLFEVFKTDTSLPFITAPNEVLLYPNMWASQSMTWNTTVLTPPEPYTWNAMWSPEIPTNHVMIQGGGDDAIATAGLANGVPQERIYSMQGDELQAAVDKLKDLKPFQLNPNVNAQFRKAISSERAWIGLTSDLSAGPLINLEAKKSIAKSVVPKEGSLGWVDGPQLVKGAKNRDNALKFIDFFAGNTELLKYLWTTYRFAQCNQTQVDNIISGGGVDAAFLKGIQGEDPSVVTEMLFQKPADDPAAWAAAWDEVQGA